MQLWDRGEGVISMHLFHNIHSAEAFIREGAMIESIGFFNNLIFIHIKNSFKGQVI